MALHSLKYCALVAVLALGIAAPHDGHASHHFESPLAINHPALDLTDLYVFEGSEPNTTAFIIDINPNTGKDGKAAFSADAVYSIHIAADAQAITGTTLTVYLDGNDMVLGLLDGANQAVGAKGREIGRFAVGHQSTLKDGIRAWAGAARDPFVGNSQGLELFQQALDRGRLDLTSFKEGQDLFASLSTSAIVLQVPNRMLPTVMWVYATSALYNVDKWEQVNRIAHPLITHLFMYNNPIEVAEHVGHRPDIDMKQRYALSALVTRARLLDGKPKRQLVADADALAVALLPDMIPYKAGTKAAYSFPNINGRRPSDDAMDTALSLLLGRKVTDNANTFDRHPVHFPYLVPIGTNGA